MTDTDGYRTLSGRGRARFVVEGSKFIGHAIRAECVDAAEAFLDEIEDEHEKATHNVPAYRVRADPFREYANDDGEPSGSAGKPILSVLQGRDLENVAVVVTRYYGGTKLGVGGLVRAYTRAASDAVDAAGIVDRLPHERVSLVVEYDDSGTVRSILKSEGVDFDAEYTEQVTFVLDVPTADAAEIRDRLRSATSGRVGF